MEFRRLNLHPECGKILYDGSVERYVSVKTTWLLPFKVQSFYIKAGGVSNGALARKKKKRIKSVKGRVAKHQVSFKYCSSEVIR